MVRMGPLDATLAQLAARQYGVVTRRQLESIGFGQRAIARRIAAGRLHRLHRGVYAVGHTAVSQHGRWLAAVLACGEGALLSHRSAAALWGMLPTAATAIDVTVPPGNGHRTKDHVRVHRARRAAASHLGIPLTSPRCTLDDLAAAKLPAWQLRRATEAAERLGVAVTPSGPRSPLEAEFLTLCGDDPPRVNEVVAGLEVDFHWPDRRLIIETDGHEHHGTSAAFERDRERDQQLIAAGWTVIRFTHRQVHEEPARIRGLLLSLTPERAQAAVRAGSK
jgi:Transcriptional regulator, AbiEi antitoxin/Protein of unknown function (DUF559)